MSARQQDNRRLILCIDGGGVRGIIPAMILRELEEKLISKNKNASVGSYFDLIAGTSTGGIIALGLCAPSRVDKTKPACTPADLVNLYKNKSATIFGTTQAIPIFGLTFDELYESAPLEKILDEILGYTTSDQVLTDFIVTAYEIEDRRPKIYSSKRYDERTPKYYLKDLARATSAAPTFFEPAMIEKLHRKGEFESLVDGGLFAANPSMVALIHAIRLGWNPEDITILSLGTGLEARPYIYHEVKQWGNFSWVSPSKGVPIVSMLMQSQTAMTDEYLNVLLNRNETNIENKRYLRIDGPLLKGMGSDDLDDKSTANIRQLQAFARRLIDDEENQKILENVAEIA